MLSNRSQWYQRTMIVATWRPKATASSKNVRFSLPAGRWPSRANRKITPLSSSRTSNILKIIQLREVVAAVETHTTLKWTSRRVRRPMFLIQKIQLVESVKTRYNISSRRQIHSSAKHLLTSRMPILTENHQSSLNRVGSESVVASPLSKKMRKLC